MSLLSNDLLETIRGAGPQTEAGVRLAEVVSTDSSGTKIKFYGEETASQKKYKRINTYTPASGDKVLMVNVNGSFLIIGKVEN